MNTTDTYESVMHVMLTRLNESKRALKAIEPLELDHPYILECDGVHLKFEDSENLGSVHVVSPAHASTFAHDLAHATANYIANGAGTRAKPVLLKDALREDIRITEHLISVIEGNKKRQPL